MTWTFAWEMLWESQFPESCRTLCGRRFRAAEKSGLEDHVWLGPRRPVFLQERPGEGRGRRGVQSSRPPGRLNQGAPRRLQARAPGPHSSRDRPAGFELAFASLLPPPSPRRLAARVSAWSLHSWGSSSWDPSRFGKEGPRGGGDVPVRAFGGRFVVFSPPVCQGLQSSLRGDIRGARVCWGPGAPEEEGCGGAGAEGAGTELRALKAPALQWLWGALRSKDLGRGKGKTCW